MGLGSVGQVCAISLARASDRTVGQSVCIMICFIATDATFLGDPAGLQGGKLEGPLLGGGAPPDHEQLHCGPLGTGLCPISQGLDWVSCWLV